MTIVPWNPRNGLWFWTEWLLASILFGLALYLHNEHLWLAAVFAGTGVLLVGGSLWEIAEWVGERAPS